MRTTGFANHSLCLATQTSVTEGSVGTTSRTEDDVHAAPRARIVWSLKPMVFSCPAPLRLPQTQRHYCLRQGNPRHFLFPLSPQVSLIPFRISSTLVPAPPPPLRLVFAPPGFALPTLPPVVLPLPPPVLRAAARALAPGGFAAAAPPPPPPPRRDPALLWGAPRSAALHATTAGTDDCPPGLARLVSRGSDSR